MGDVMRDWLAGCAGRGWEGVALIEELVPGITSWRWAGGCVALRFRGDGQGGGGGVGKTKSR